MGGKISQTERLAGFPGLAETDFSDRYILEEEISKGAFSVVHRCIDRTNELELAVKIVNTKNLSMRGREQSEQEARICAKLKHKNIVHLYHFIHEENVNYMIFDLVSGGDLFGEIILRERFSEADASHCIEQILEAINHCHINNIVHRDIEPENILLAREAEGLVIKLAGFGMAIEIQSEQPAWYGYAGTPGYHSPEMLKMKPHGKPVDIWACGKYGQDVEAKRELLCEKLIELHLIHYSTRCHPILYPSWTPAILHRL